MIRVSLLLALISVCTSISLGNTAPQQDRLRAELGIIVPAHEAKVILDLDPDRDGIAWTPSYKEIAYIEPILAAFLTARLRKIRTEPGVELPHTWDYHRQYVGLDKHGKRTILIIGFHRWIVDHATTDFRNERCSVYGEEEETTRCSEAPPKSADFWRHENVAASIFDGCHSIFWASYDVKTKAVVRFSFDGCV